MTASAETIPARLPAPVLRQRRCRLSHGLAAVAEAREHVRAAILDWGLPVSADIAVLATWDLVTSLLTEGPGGTDGTERPAGPIERAAVPPGEGPCGPLLYGPVTPGMVRLGINGARGRLRVDAYDGRRSLWGTPGLAIVASLADDWGRYQTPAGRAAYFTLSFTVPFFGEIAGAAADAATGPDAIPQGGRAGADVIPQGGRADNSKRLRVVPRQEPAAAGDTSAD